MKKGEVRTAVIVAVVAVVVLVMVIIWVFPWIASKTSYFKFDFNKIKEDTKGIEILRYDLTKGKVEYYDGTKFIDFSGKSIKLGDKEIEYNTVKKNFDDYVTDDISLVIYDAKLKLIDGGRVLIVLKPRQEYDHGFSYYRVHPQGKDDEGIFLRYLTGEGPSNGWEWAPRSNFITWRDSFSIEVESCKFDNLYIGQKYCELIKNLRGLSKEEGGRVLVSRGFSSYLFPSTAKSLHLRNPYILDLNNELFSGENRLSIEGSSNYELFLKEKVIGWKENTLLWSPLGLDQRTPLQPVFMCPELFDKKFLVVYLNKIVSRMEICKK